MSNLELVLENVIKSYNEKKTINLMDLMVLNNEFVDSSEVNELVDLFDSKEPLNYIHVRNLENLINKTK